MHTSLKDTIRIKKKVKVKRKTEKGLHGAHDNGSRPCIQTWRPNRHHWVAPETKGKETKDKTTQRVEIMVAAAVASNPERKLSGLGPKRT